MENLYYMDRGENAHVFAIIKKNKSSYNVTIHFKCGFTHNETWTEEDFNELLNNNIIFKVDEMSWEKIYEKPKKGKKKK